MLEALRCEVHALLRYKLEGEGLLECIEDISELCVEGREVILCERATGRKGEKRGGEKGERRTCGKRYVRLQKCRKNMSLAKKKKDKETY